MSTQHLSEGLIRCPALSRVSVPRGSAMTFVDLFGAEWQKQRPCGVLLKDRGLTGTGQVPHLCTGEAVLSPHTAHPGSCPTESTALAAFKSLACVHIELPHWWLRCRGQKHTQNCFLRFLSPSALFEAWMPNGSCYMVPLPNSLPFAPKLIFQYSSQQHLREPASQQIPQVGNVHFRAELWDWETPEGMPKAAVHSCNIALWSLLLLQRCWRCFSCWISN